MRERAFRWILLLALLVSAWPAAADRAVAQDGSEGVYEDPEGRFSIPIPSGWTVEEADGYGVLASPGDEITMAALAVEADDAAAGIAAGWELVEPGFDLEPIHTQDIPARPGADDAVVITYDIGQESGEVVQGVAEVADGVAYVLLIRADLIAAQERASQINIIATGLTIAGIEEVDLTGVQPLPFEGDLIDAFETYVAETLDLLEVPGATIAVVQGGEVVYRQGFGATEAGGDEPVTPEMRMMIGSTTKSATTMMLATLVDEGLIDWETPVVEVLPSFAVADPELTPQITVRDLVCACTGVPRRDLELLFSFGDLTAEDIVASVAEFQFFTPIGEAFQYSNQMVATGGYAGAAAAGDGADGLYDAYVAAMTERVLAPIGMENSTFSFAEVEASGDYATPHGLNVDGEYVAIPLGLEEFVTPVAPAGALWSNVDDMARYLLTELAGGAAPDGTAVVSAENLERTWEPQVPVAAGVSYGLGWFIEAYKGQTLIHHGGNTIGFTSDLAFLPETDLGIVVLTNGQASTLFNLAVRYRLLELVFEQEPEFQAYVEAVVEGLVAEETLDTRVPAPVGTPEVETRDVDPEVVETFLGEYVNESLGTIVIELENGDLVLDAGEFRTELGAVPDGPAETTGIVFVMADPPLAGFPVELRLDNGEPTVIVGEGVAEYTFLVA